MSEYVKTTWSKGDVITAAKMNNIEDGIDSITNQMFDLTGIEAQIDSNGYFYSYDGGLTVDDLIGSKIKFPLPNGIEGYAVCVITTAVTMTGVTSYMCLIDDYVNGTSGKLMVQYIPIDDGQYGTGFLVGIHETNG